MKFLLSLLFVFLVGCTVPVPVTQKFPDVPKSFLVEPAPLKEVPDNSTFSELLDIVLDNYSQYYTQSDSIRLWQKWYIQNKEIFEKEK